MAQLRNSVLLPEPTIKRIDANFEKLRKQDERAAKALVDACRKGTDRRINVDKWEAVQNHDLCDSQGRINANVYNVIVSAMISGTYKRHPDGPIVATPEPRPTRSVSKPLPLIKLAKPGTR